MRFGCHHVGINAWGIVLSGPTHTFVMASTWSGRCLPPSTREQAQLVGMEHVIRLPRRLRPSRMATSIRPDSQTATAAVHVREPPMSTPTTGWPRRGGAGRLNTRCSSATRNKGAPAPSPSGPRLRRRAAKDEAATGSVRAASTSRRMPSWNSPAWFAVAEREEPTETGLGSTARCCGRRRHRQANSVRVCSPTSRRVASLRPRSAGLTALTPGSSRLALADDAHSYTPYMLWSTVLSRMTLFRATVDSLPLARRPCRAGLGRLPPGRPRRRCHAPVRHRRAAKHLEGMQGIGRPAARGEVATDVV